MASPTWWTWVWTSSRSWWWTGKPGMLQSMWLQRVGHNWATELHWFSFYVIVHWFFSQFKPTLLNPTLVNILFWLLKYIWKCSGNFNSSHLILFMISISLLVFTIRWDIAILAFFTLLNIASFSYLDIVVPAFVYGVTQSRTWLKWLSSSNACFQGFPCGLDVKKKKKKKKNRKICLQCRRLGFYFCVEKMPWRREWLPTPVFLRGKSHGQRSQVG